MELQERTIKVRRMIEVVVQQTTDHKWRFTQSGMVALYIERSLNELPTLFNMAEIDDERIVDYVVYQLYRLRESIKKGRWQSTWLFSQIAKEKYKNQFLSENGKSGINYYIDLWLSEAGLSRGKLVSLIAKPKPSPLKNMLYLASEEPVKKRFFNTEAGLILCQSSTTGWSPFSETCDKCDNRVQCEEMTARKYPELVRYRKESRNG